MQIMPVNISNIAANLDISKSPVRFGKSIDEYTLDNRAKARKEDLKSLRRNLEEAKKEYPVYYRESRKELIHQVFHPYQRSAYYHPSPLAPSDVYKVQLLDLLDNNPDILNELDAQINSEEYEAKKSQIIDEEEYSPMKDFIAKFMNAPSCKGLTHHTEYDDYGQPVTEVYSTHKNFLGLKRICPKLLFRIVHGLIEINTKDGFVDYRPSY